jgi:hypothetical protein
MDLYFGVEMSASDKLSYSLPPKPKYKSIPLTVKLLALPLRLKLGGFSISSIYPED